MARKETVTIQMILDTAFDMVKTEGFESITARRVANAVGCSTQPVFRVFKNMSELQSAVYFRAVRYFQEYIDTVKKVSDIPFVNLGLAYISFAREEKNYFKLLFVNGIPEGKNMYEIINGKDGKVSAEINKSRSMGCSEPAEMFMRMWIFVHGSACMTLTGDYDLDDEETVMLLERSYEAFKKS
ncbi:MAG: TetR/AcrR family transcriptional regulator [Lachnospiraceae bacterium]|nr:TetR/AcrR family transcriptional regulator [Lachnospiraceae bacterium]